MAGGLDPASRAALKKMERLPEIIARDALRELRKAARDASAAAKAAILAAPAVKYPDRGLRAEIAKTVHARSRVSATDAYVAVESLGREMPEGKGELPAYSDGSKPHWRHPVFAPEGTSRKDWTWKDQAPVAPGWFYGTMRRRRDSFIRASQRGMDQAARDVGR